MPLANKYKLTFNAQELMFDDTYIEELSESVYPEEFDAVLRTINTEHAMKIQKCNRSIKKWMKIVGISSIFIIGILLSPILLTKVSNQKKNMEAFWEKVKDYLYHVNKKTYLKRGVEWRLEQDKRQIKGRDAVNPLAAYRLVIICEPSRRRSMNKEKGRGKEKGKEIEKEINPVPRAALPSTSSKQLASEREAKDTVKELADLNVPIRDLDKEHRKKDGDLPPIVEEGIESNENERKSSQRSVDSLLQKMQEMDLPTDSPTSKADKRKTILRPKLDGDGNPILVRKKVKKPTNTYAI